MQDNVLLFHVLISYCSKFIMCHKVTGKHNMKSCGLVGDVCSVVSRQ